MHIVWENLDKSIAITILAKDTVLEDEKIKLESQNPDFTFKGYIESADLPNVSKAEMFDKDGVTILTKAVPVVVVQDYFYENETAIKKEVNNNFRHFRSAWVWDSLNNKIVEDPTKVKQLRSDNVRYVRTQLLKETDADEFRLEGSDLTDIQIYRQSLRDLGTAIDSDPENVIFPTKPIR